MAGTDLCVNKPHKSRSYLNRLVYDYTTKWRRQQSEVIQNQENEHIRSIGQGKARHRKYKRLKLGGGQAYDRSSD
jgi:hypothetical protein